MVTRFSDQAEEMLSQYTIWLNTWFSITEPEGNTYEFQVTRESYDEWDSPPKLLLDQEILYDTGFQQRIIVIYCDPYHDEGGPTILTGYFDYNSFSNEGTYELRHMIQEFDTDRQVILDAGQLVYRGVETPLAGGTNETAVQSD